jgi:hypothetical protein
MVSILGANLFLRKRGHSKMRGYHCCRMS